MSTQFFRCEALRSTLSAEGCAANWRKAQRATPDELGWMARCSGCCIGAAHAGERPVRRSPLFGLGLCARCRRGGGRMIPMHGVCVSCSNRQAEFVLGFNRKGTRLTLKLDPRRLAVIVDGKAIEIRNPMTRDTVEIALSVLGTTPGKLYFTRARGGPAISSLALADRYREKKRHQLHGAALSGGKRRKTAA
jgi:hypothetical protein